MSLNRPPSLIHYDRSGAINTDTGEPQILFPRNPKRVGMLFQNQGTADMTLVVKAARDGQGDTHWIVQPKCEWFYDQHGPINEVQVIGTPGDKFAACEFGD